MIRHKVKNSKENKFHQDRRQQEKRNKEILFDGKCFYNVMIIAINRIWKERMLRVSQEPDDFIEAVCGEMTDVFGEGGDFEQIRQEETGIEFSLR